VSAIVLMVEGQGDTDASVALARRVLQQVHTRVQSSMYIDKNPLKVGNLTGLLSKNKKKPTEHNNFIRYLQVAGKKPDVSGVLLLLDGDVQKMSDPVYKKNYGDIFCAANAARYLSAAAAQLGAGQRFSFATVFAMQEFESWILAGITKLKGKHFVESCLQISSDMSSIPADLEVHPRDAKSLLKKLSGGTYRETIHQKVFAECPELLLADISARMRSFRRFEHAIEQFVYAQNNRQPVCSPMP
jgi:hypothetical protein